MTSAISCAIFTLNQGVIDLFLVHFVSNGHPLIDAQVVLISQQLFQNAQGAGTNRRAAKVLCDFVEDHLTVFQLLNHNNGSHEKLAIMIIDGALDPGVNLSTLSNEFLGRNIVWVLIGVTTPNFQTWNSYKRFTGRTGGLYVYMTDAVRILSQVLSSVLTGRDTLRQAFLHNELSMANRNDDINEQDQPTDGVGDLPFDHGLSY